MDEQLLEQAYRNAVFSSKSSWKPILWAFLPLLHSHLELLNAEKQALMDYGNFDPLD